MTKDGFDVKGYCVEKGTVLKRVSNMSLNALREGRNPHRYPDTGQYIDMTVQGTNPDTGVVLLKDSLTKEQVEVPVQYIEKHLDDTVWVQE